MPNAPQGERFPPSLRLRSRPQFDAVFSRRIRASDQRITLFALPNSEAFSRLGIAVSRRTGNAALRNRLKRRIREVFRRNRSQLPAGVDYVVVPQPGQDTPLPAIRDSFLTLAARLQRQVEAARESASADKQGGTPVSQRAKRKHQVP